MTPILGIARGGWPIVGAFALGAAGAWAMVLPLGAWGLLVAAPATAVFGWCVWFFRDPERRAPRERGVMVSAADGVVCYVGPGAPPLELPGPWPDSMTRVSVFMNIFNVHVNRAPAAGRIAAVAYRPGKFLNASLDKASEDNERLALAVDLERGAGRLAVVQIAGLVARRIVRGVRHGADLDTGERIGLIRFGSRVDVYFARGLASPSVRVGERVRAGETVIARLAGVDAGAAGSDAGSGALAGAGHG